MDPGTQNPNPNPNPSPKSVYHIGGIPVEFPYKPYGSQLAFMGRVIYALDRAQKQGHSHALLESPTGTGKTLSLLCSVLAWQRQYESKNRYANLSHSKPDPEALSDPLGHGGGFVPETQPSIFTDSPIITQTGSGNFPAETSAPDLPTQNSGNQKKKAVRQIPTIFYASRTHAQISQAIREYRKTSYRVRMAVLGSRKHYCTNKHVRGKENLDEECKLLMKSMEGDQGCVQFRNVHKVIGHPSLQKGGCNEAYDIEDLVKVGYTVRGCSYFASRTMAQEAQLVFCPYSYILSPTIRRAMEVDLKKSIVILDEAHNIEDMARDAASVDIEEDVLNILQGELEQLCLADSPIYTPLHDMIQGLISWIGRKADTLGKREFQHYCSCWTGDKASGELQEAGISPQFFPILQECAIKAIKAASDADTDIHQHLSGLSVIALEGLFSSLGYFFSGNGSHALDYQLVLQRYPKKDAGRTAGKLTQCFSMWCMNPAVSFTEITNLSMSVILTSGTLSPMSSFSSELGVKFETCMEAPHVIDVNSQLWSAVISTGPGNYPLNASYKTADGYDFQDALGTSLEEICKVVPGGALVFFPSYNLMEKLCARWRETGQWSRLNAQKSLFVEPRGHQDDFELTLKGYYDSIRHGRGSTAGKIKRGNKRGFKLVDLDETPQPSMKGGSAFLAVCRGKVSEGIDFSDENARVVVIVGIPFPNIHDLKVGQKKSFNDMYKSSKRLLSGSEWYCQQAFRALNQAAGRCIRHRFDYGAIIFMDERFKEERNIAYVSKWLRSSIRKYNSFDMTLDGLRSFFEDAKERYKLESTNGSNDSGNDDEIALHTKPMNLIKGPGRRKNRRNRSNHPSGEEESSMNMVKTRRTRMSRISSIPENGSSTLHKFYGNTDVDTTFALTDVNDVGKCDESINLECGTCGDLRPPGFTPSAFSLGSLEQFVVKETPGMHDNINVANSAVISNNENSNSTLVQACNDLSDQVSFHSSPLEQPSRNLFKGKHSLMVTPERMGVVMNGVKLETDSSFNLSVNSHTLKRRKPMNFALVNHFENDPYGSIDVKFPVVECTSMSAFRDANRKIEFDSEKCPTGSCGTSSDVFLGKRLHLCCSLCKNSLGLPDNQFLVECLLTSCSKVYLVSLQESRSEDVTANSSDRAEVVISDTASVDQKLSSGSTSEGSGNHDVWSEKDGCVFRTVFCPFCTVSDRVLGLRIMAADALNVNLLNKILFYFDRLEIKNIESSKDKTFLQEGDSVLGHAANSHIHNNVSTDSDHIPVAEMTPIEKFSYFPEKTSGGWRTTKSKLSLRKRGLISDSGDQCSTQK